ncbi:MAG: RdgB/HAM1 family non-canonical purine NTP pyrophosphatase [Alphaproteobacteria bacterium]|jgi:XTP/dITP diphosphohydrolase|uniref:RdgB/HAM1 family non-canonical purine NTP pyrophosphatase n=1 Tax=Brevundimonas TaxID=41275 RepID=UPI001A2E34E6|nr:RdgB/HAM1 family non-canonical purine NTP pyrophosphatase [Brevundimonas sp.]MBU1272506.1 RdgB/HAM1 family non-canonical purine NTP pyrophosphatase [Alphaproteobacteria bacterium]MBJ7318615.1 RdgB/HAM1 family non-canonical purine NTP pyrophosphatase [Brevundimonas sp.]MBU1520683.1 RdgB/HAM1 family non-canonical purine NTP pyrophosphatase [Alphaproteobacteria bacterium]MBU2029312.1 RdgB/HAM1 family non-canonical purine NTP pyrophosphatase [Alphaproteobacteria bacterium]MBU2164222.1 RdgB/HAM1
MTLKLFKGMRIVAATHNPGKVPEIAALLGEDYEILTAGQLNLPEPDETETTFAGNAMLKARHAAALSGEVALADDSGMSVAALDGAPGIFSARWAGPGKDFAVAMKKVEDRLEEIGATDRAAWFTSALAVAWPDGPCVVVEGEVHGRLTFPPRGDRGFGYDPIFIPEGGDLTFGEMEPAAKEAISHRTRAFAKLRAALID